MYFSQKKYFHLCVETAREGLDVLERDKNINVVIADIKLPGMDGETFLLKAHALNPGLHFFILTGDRYYKPSSELLEIGFTPQQVFTKPLVDLDDFCSLVLNQVGK